MRRLYYFLKNHKPKHNLRFWLELKELDNDVDLSIHFTIFGNNWNNFITIYSFDSELENRTKVDKIRKLLNNKRKALLFIGGPNDIK